MESQAVAALELILNDPVALQKEANSILDATSSSYSFGFDGIYIPEERAEPTHISLFRPLDAKGRQEGGEEQRAETQTQTQTQTQADLQSRAPVATLGDLERLPVEILSAVCLSLDVESALRFSHVNRRARSLTASTPRLRALGAHGLRCLSALFGTGIASHVECRALYAALAAKHCALCGDAFAGYVFLPTVTRCCFACVDTAPELRASTLDRVARKAGIPEGELRGLGLPVMTTLAGNVGVARSRSLKLVSQSHCLELLGGTRAMRDPGALLSTFRNGSMFRLMALVKLPWFNARTGKVETGVSCRGCRSALHQAPAAAAAAIEEEEEPLEKPHREYYKDEFLDHFRRCGRARNLWVQGQGAERLCAV